MALREHQHVSVVVWVEVEHDIDVLAAMHALDCSDAIEFGHDATQHALRRVIGVGLHRFAADVLATPASPQPFESICHEGPFSQCRGCRVERGSIIASPRRDRTQ